MAGVLVKCPCDRGIDTTRAQNARALSETDDSNSLCQVIWQDELGFLPSQTKGDLC